MTKRFLIVFVMAFVLMVSCLVLAKHLSDQKKAQCSSVEDSVLFEQLTEQLRKERGLDFEDELEGMR